MATNTRTDTYTRDNRLEDVLGEINAAIKPIMQAPYSSPKYPVVMIMGVARSGTTLMLQSLAHSGLFAYPSNLIARFHTNPYMGARIQQALHDYDKGNQIGLQGRDAFSSDLGRSKGALAPSEFWYFWRNHYDLDDNQFPGETSIAATDINAVRQGLAGLESAYDKPVALKGMMHNYLIEHLDQMLDHAIFVHVHRDPVMNVQSLLSARERFYGTRDRWYSFKPPEFRALETLSPIEQVAGQVFYANRAIENSLKSIVQDRKITVAYEDFCRSPDAIMESLRQKFSGQGFALGETVTPLTPFSPSIQSTLKASEIAEIEAAFEQFRASDD